MKTLTIDSKLFHKPGMRVDGAYHLSDGPLSRLALSHSPYESKTLSLCSNRIFSGNIFRRTYVESSEFGYPYLTGSDMVKADLDTGKFISKKYTSQKENLEIHKGWILVSCSGTLGNTVYTHEGFEGHIGTHDLIRIVPNGSEIKSGFLYAYLASKFGKALLVEGSYGGVVKHIEPHHIADLPVPVFPKPLEEQIHQLITEASGLRVGANELLENSRTTLLKEAGLSELSSDEYEFFGNHAASRKLSVSSILSSEIDSLTINAFNYSRRIKTLIERVKKANKSISLIKGLQEPGFFSTGSFPRVELDSPNAIQLINQTDIFNVRMVGKHISRRKVKTDKLVSYEEVLIAGVGTLGENETFCRTIFAGEELSGKLVSGEFIRMKTNDIIPPGYLYAWLSSDYGFRLIRSTQTGTKLCRPIQALLQEIPVPVLNETEMKKIDAMVKQAHTKRFQALEKENQAIAFVENEINSWQN